MQNFFFFCNFIQINKLKQYKQKYKEKKIKRKENKLDIFSLCEFLNVSI